MKSGDGNIDIASIRVAARNDNFELAKNVYCIIKVDNCEPINSRPARFSATQKDPLN
jgi:hypothetical protein